MVDELKVSSPECGRLQFEKSACDVNTEDSRKGTLFLRSGQYFVAAMK